MAAKFYDVGLLGDDDLAQPSRVREEVVAWAHSGGQSGNAVPGGAGVCCASTIVGPRHRYDVFDLGVLVEPFRFVLEIDPNATPGWRIELGDVENLQRKPTSS